MTQYTLIIAEKPTAAHRIAVALDNKHKPQRNRKKGVPYFVAKRDRKILVIPALGHLYTVTQKAGQKTRYPVFHFTWAPRHLVEKKRKKTKRWIDAITELGRDADIFIDACDYDIEGSLIGYMILHHALKKANMAKRMKYSTLTNSELRQAYANLAPTLDFNLIKAGKTRHEIDWLYGINLSRALTTAVKKAASTYAPLSTGRVQGPTLHFLVKRETAIATFIPVPYWTIRAHIQIKGKTYEAQYHQKTIETKIKANTIVKACQGKPGNITQIQRRTYNQAPPVPFDLGTLQREAYRNFGYTPRRTANIAEHLYLAALISYPRTSSQKLPPTINYKAILTGLRKTSAHRSLALQLLRLKNLRPKEGRKEDSAHPAIYPTGNVPERRLSSSKRKLWNLITRRFLATFAAPAIKERVKTEINVNGHLFFLVGRRILKEGWMQYYKPYVHFKEALLPDLKEGEMVEVEKLLLEDKFTKPPPRYNPSSLLKKMETNQIGTKATRANIIQTLYDRKYITMKRIKVTQLGQHVIEILQRHAPTVISVRLTQELEEEMQRIQKNEKQSEKILSATIDRLKPVLEEMKNSEDKIGQTLAKSVKKTRRQDRIVGDCPTCKTGKLIILRSRKTGKRFVGCTNYFKNRCQTSFPLPQKGTIRPTGTNCTACGWSTLRVFRRERSPWTLCLNPSCPKKK